MRNSLSQNHVKLKISMRTANVLRQIQFEAKLKFYRQRSIEYILEVLSNSIKSIYGRRKSQSLCCFDFLRLRRQSVQLHIQDGHLWGWKRECVCLIKTNRITFAKLSTVTPTSERRKYRRAESKLARIEETQRGTGRRPIVIIKESSCLVVAVPSNKAITNVARWTDELLLSTIVVKTLPRLVDFLGPYTDDSNGVDGNPEGKAP